MGPPTMARRNTKCCEERAVKLRLEKNNGFEMSWKFCQHVLVEISEFWTISDWTELGLVEPSLNSFDVSCHEFCTVFIFSA